MKTVVKSLSLAMLAALLVVACAAFVGCGESSTPQKSTGAVNIKDATGADFHLDKPVDKVVGTHNPTLNCVVVVGGGGKYLAGFGEKNKADGLYKEVIEDWDKLEQIGKGKNVNYETVAKSGAQLVVLPERQKAMAKDYKDKAGLDSLIALPNKESFDTVKESLERIGAIFGENERVKQVNAEFDKLIKSAKDACASAKDKPSVVFMGDNRYEVATSSMIQTDIIDAVGATNAVSGDYKEGEFAEVDAETIVKFNPEVIWIPAYADYTAEDILADEKLASVQAVKDKKVYKFPSALEPWDYPTASTCLGVCWAAYNLHPDQFSKDKLQQSCDEFYKLLYNKSFTLDQLGVN
ncbi:MAG: ABC transporter substrate-binding protein [Coriobacteriales bacterium]|nr:ABC transporter substrate-binding protein [Coriobacteriales bacterium]